MRYAAAGHPPLLWWRSSERRIVELEENGLLLGIMPAAQFRFRKRHWIPEIGCHFIPMGCWKPPVRLESFLARNAFARAWPPGKPMAHRRLVSRPGVSTD